MTDHHDDPTTPATSPAPVAPSAGAARAPPKGVRGAAATPSATA